MEWIALAVLGVGFLALIVWVNFYALDDDTPDPGQTRKPVSPDPSGEPTELDAPDDDDPHD